MIWSISSHFGSICGRFGIPPDPILVRFWLFLLAVVCFAIFENQSQNISTYNFFHENCSKMKFSSKPFLQEIMPRPAVTQAKQDAQTTKPLDLQLAFGGMRGAFEPDLAGERKAQFGICCENVDSCCHLWNLLFCVGSYCYLQRFAAI